MPVFLSRTVTLSSQRLCMRLCRQLNRCYKKVTWTKSMNCEEKMPEEIRSQDKFFTMISTEDLPDWNWLHMHDKEMLKQALLKFEMEKSRPARDFSNEVAVSEKIYQRHFMIEELVTNLVKESKDLRKIQNVAKRWLSSGHFTHANAVETLVKFAKLFRCFIDECFPDFKHLPWSEKKKVLNIPHYCTIFREKVQPQDYSEFVQHIVNIISGDINSLNKLETIAVLHALTNLDVEEKTQQPFSTVIKQLFDRYLSFDIGGYGLDEMKKLLEIGQRQNEPQFWEKQLNPLINDLDKFDKNVLKFFEDLELQCKYQPLMKQEWIPHIEKLLEKDVSFCLSCLAWLKAVDGTRIKTANDDHLDVYTALKRLKPKLETTLKENCGQLIVSEFKTVYELLMDFNIGLKIIMQDQAKEILNSDQGSSEELFWCLCVYGKTEGLNLSSDRLCQVIQSCDITGTMLVLKLSRQEPVPLLFNSDMSAAVLGNITKHAHFLASRKGYVPTVCAYLIELFISDYIIPRDVVSSLNSAVGPSSEHYNLIRLTLMSMDKGRPGNLVALCSKDALQTLFNLNPYFYLTFVYAKYSDEVGKRSDVTAYEKNMQQFLECTLSTDIQLASLGKLTLQHLYKILKHSWSMGALSEILHLFGIWSKEHSKGSAEMDQHVLSMAVLSYMVETIYRDGHTCVSTLDMLYLGSLALDFKDELLSKHPETLQILNNFVKMKFADEAAFFSSKNSKEDCESILRLVNICSCLGVDMERTMGQIFTHRFMKLLSGKFRPMTESVLKVMFALNQDCCLLYPQLGVPWFQQPDMLQTIHNKQLSQLESAVPASLRERLQHTLAGVSIQEPLATEYGLVPWSVFLVDNDNKPVKFTEYEVGFAEELGLKRVAVVYNAERGIDRFRDNTFRDPVSIDVYLEKLGYTVMKISATQWNKLLVDTKEVDLTYMLNKFSSRKTLDTYIPVNQSMKN